MGNFKNFVNEAKEHQVYFCSNELWISSGQGSGMTSQFPKIERFITNKSGDKTYDSNVDRLVKWSKVEKPFKKQANSKMYEISEYPLTRMGQTYDIWGGDVKPIGKLYLIIDTGTISVVNLFKSKNEATAWLKSLA